MSKKRGKSNRDLERRKGSRQPRKFILIVVEGQETEYNYFSGLKNDLKLPTTNIKVVSGSGGSCIDIVEKVISICEANQEDNQKKGTPKYDEVFCVFDGDRPEYKKAMDDAHNYSASKIQPILSIPCFELWFLLHFRFTSSPFQNCKEVILQLNQDLKKKKLENYVKSKLDWYGLLKPKLNDAIKNAQNLENQLPESDSYANPSTKIHHLVTHLQAQKNFS